MLVGVSVKASILGNKIFDPGVGPFASIFIRLILGRLPCCLFSEIILISVWEWSLTLPSSSPHTTPSSIMPLVSSTKLLLASSLSLRISTLALTGRGETATLKGWRSSFVNTISLSRSLLPEPISTSLSLSTSSV